MVAHAPIVYRDRVAIHADARAEGASQPDYSAELLDKMPAEVRQVAGGEVVRGRTVEAITSLVISMRLVPGVPVGADCQVTILSGPHKGMVCWVNYVHVEDMHSRPVRWQLHCRTRRK